jgi:hypothetical protein
MPPRRLPPAALFPPTRFPAAPNFPMRGCRDVAEALSPGERCNGHRTELPGATRMSGWRCGG